MKTSEEIRTAIAAVDNDLRVIHTRAAAARLAIDQLRKRAIVSLAFARGGEDDNPANHVGAIIDFSRSDAGRDLAAASVVLDVLEKDPAFAEARAVLDPLHAELVHAEAREANELHRLLQAEAALADAEQAARGKLEAKIQDDKQVKEARAALAGIKRLGEPLDDLDPASEFADFH